MSESGQEIFEIKKVPEVRNILLGTTE